jgi:hypothetical protein
MPFNAQTGQWEENPNYNYNWFGGGGHPQQQPGLSHALDTGGGSGQQPGMIGNGSIPAIVPRPAGLQSPNATMQPPPPPPSPGAMPPPSADSGLGYYNGRDMRYLNPYTYSAPPPPRHPDLGTSVNMPAPATGFLPTTQPQPTMQTPTQIPVPGGAGAPGPAGMVNPDAAFPKYDPAYLAQIQAALESPNGPYAGRQPGDYGPTGAPDFVLNPMGMDQWRNRFYWFAEHPEALSNPTAPRQVQMQAAPQQQFTHDVYSDANANPSFAELSGTVDDTRLKQAQDVFGWQSGPAGIASNEEAVTQANALKGLHPEYSYQVYKYLDGSYGIMARELDQQAQQARDFFAPGQRPAPPPPPPRPTYQTPHKVSASYGSGGGKSSSYGKGGGGGYPTPKPVSQAPAPVASAPKPAPSIDLRMVGGQVNMNQPVEGQIVNYNGQLVQFRGGKWVPYAYHSPGQNYVSPA